MQIKNEARIIQLLVDTRILADKARRCYDVMRRYEEGSGIEKEFFEYIKSLYEIASELNSMERSDL